MPRFPTLFLLLAVPFVATATVPVFLLGFEQEKTLATALDRSAQSMISATSEEKAKRLDALGREHVRAALAIASDPSALVLLARSAEPASDAAARIDALLGAFELPRVALLGVDGGTAFERTASREEDGPALESVEDAQSRAAARAEAVRRIRRGDAAAITRPDKAPNGTRPALEAIAPVRDANGAIAGHAVVGIDLARIDAIVGETTGLGKTGESICAVVLGNEAVVTTPTRADPDAAYALRWNLGERKLVRLEEVLFGNSGRGEDKDLDGEAVLGAWTRIESLGWSIAVTQRRHEISAPLEPVRQRTMLVAAVAGAAALVVAAIAAWLLSRGGARAAKGPASRS
ncbi:MAG: hypothetical protein GC172_14020 [Phycisphaera sp.]|nr:hypothetical protein [Phycisphaera sp.]